MEGVDYFPMMPQQTKRRLGRGLAALIGDDTGEAAMPSDAQHVKRVPIEFLRPNPHNPRKIFKEDELDDLAKSIAEKGLLQPILVRSTSDSRTYEIVAGERRWRAAQRAGIHDVPVLVRELSDGEALEVALIENVQRADLNALEEAQAYSQLMEQFGYTQQQLADSIGKSRSHIANTLRLLTLPGDIRKYIEEGMLTAGHARALIATDSPADLADKIIKLGLNVREAEKLSREANDPPTKARRGRGEGSDPNIRAVERSLLEALGLKVEISEADGDGGRILIHYKSLEQLEDIIQRLVRVRG